MNQMTKIGLIAAVLGIVGLVVYLQKDALIKKALQPRVTPTTSEESMTPVVELALGEPEVVADS